MTPHASPPSEVRIVEVGPRDGLQNEAALVPSDAKVAFVEALAGAGPPVVEVTSFVSPRAVPQLADAEEVLRRVRRRPGVRYPVLVPNMRGMDRAEQAGADAVAVFTAASEAFRLPGMTAFSRSAQSASGTSACRVPAVASRRTMSPSRSLAKGPPAAASGDT